MIDTNIKEKLSIADSRYKSRINIADIIIYLLLLLFALVCVIPFYYVIMVSFSDPSLVKEGEIIFWPKGFSTEAMRIVLRQKKFLNAFEISFIRTVLGTALNLSVQCMMAYALSKKYLKGEKIFMFMVIFAMLFNGGIIPTYLIVRNTGLLDTIWALIIPNAVNPWNIIILTSFFSSIPDSIEESAKIDGANDIIIFLRLIIPLSIPAVATIGLFIAVGHWNALMDAVLYINKTTLKPLQTYLMDLIMSAQMQEMFQNQVEQELPVLSVQCAAIFAGTLPILLVYPFIQRYFVKGIMIGAIKG
jgi:putative aldouronate transport system permease protein